MNIIEFKLCAEDRARLDAILSRLQHLTAAPAPAVEAPPVGAPVAAEPEAPAPAEAPPRDKPISPAEFQKAITLRCAAAPALKPKIRDLVQRFAPSVSEIPEGRRAEFLALLNEL